MGQNGTFCDEFIETGPIWNRMDPVGPEEANMALIVPEMHDCATKANESLCGQQTGVSKAKTTRKTDTEPSKSP